MRKGRATALAVIAIVTSIVIGLAFLTPWLRQLLFRYLLQKSLQGKIHCWVKVVDQKGNGVNGYKCEVVEEYAPPWPFSSAKEVVRIYETRGDGLFEFTSKGNSGRVFFGNSWDSQWKLNPKHLLQRRSLGITSLEYQHAIRESPRNWKGSRENPYCLYVFSLGRPCKLLYWKKMAKITEDGNYICIDVLKGEVWESSKVGGDMSISKGKLGPHGELPRCFRYIVAGSKCELSPVLDDWGLLPPDSGYCKELCGPADWDAAKWSVSGTAIYYRLTDSSGTGFKYGRVQINGLLDHAQIESFTNLQGERNLYYEGYTRLLNQTILDYVSPPVVPVSRRPDRGKRDGSGIDEVENGR